MFPRLKFFAQKPRCSPKWFLHQSESELDQSSSSKLFSPFHKGKTQFFPESFQSAFIMKMQNESVFCVASTLDQTLHMASLFERVLPFPKTNTAFLPFPFLCLIAMDGLPPISREHIKRNSPSGRVLEKMLPTLSKAPRRSKAFGKGNEIESNRLYFRLFRFLQNRIQQKS